MNGKTSFAFFVALSLAGHIAGGLLSGIFGPFDLRLPVPRKPAISVTLETSAADPSPAAAGVDTHDIKPDAATPADTDYEKRNNESPADATQGDDVRQVLGAPVPALSPQALKTNPDPSEKDVSPAEVPVSKKKEEADFNSVPVPSAKKMEQGPVRTAGEFVPFAREKLTYRITMLGIPAGTAVLEATNSNGEARITARVKSNEAVSSIYPVDISTDTRLMNGNYLMTRVRRREGSTTSDTGFTLMLRERNAFWVDRRRNRYDNTPLPSGDVMDMITGFYFLRNQRLEVGRSVLLPLFDSFEYAPTTVEVLRKEHLRLPWFREADALVVHPILKTEGFFGRSGEVLVWLTDDDKRVPVRMEAQIPVGKVTAELVSAETERRSGAAANNDLREDSMQRLVKSPSVPLSQRGK